MILTLIFEKVQELEENIKELMMSHDYPVDLTTFSRELEENAVNQSKENYLQQIFLYHKELAGNSNYEQLLELKYNRLLFKLRHLRIKNLKRSIEYHHTFYEQLLMDIKVLHSEETKIKINKMKG